MIEKELTLLELFYNMTNKNTSLLPFTDYLEVIQEEMSLSTYNILSLYTSLLEKAYIKNISQDRFFITEKGLEEIKFKALQDSIFTDIKLQNTHEMNTLDL